MCDFARIYASKRAERQKKRAANFFDFSGRIPGNRFSKIQIANEPLRKVHRMPATESAGATADEALQINLGLDRHHPFPASWKDTSYTF